MSKRNILWVGFGDLARRCKSALNDLSEKDTDIVVVDVLSQDLLRSECPFPFYNLTIPSELQEFSERARDCPFDQTYIANLPQQHMLTAYEVARITTEGIVVAKPIDVDFGLVAKVRSWPYNQAQRISVHDHYCNKGSVVLLKKLLPDLISRFGQVTRLRFFLVETKTIEEEKRLDALECGVILDLMTHLFAVMQMLFPIETGISEVDKPRFTGIQINQVARARYRHCQLETVNAETFAAADITLFWEFLNVNSRRVRRNIDGLLVCGKGIRPDKNLDKPLKILELTFEGHTIQLDLSTHTISPIPRDLLVNIEVSTESGFHKPVFLGLTGESVESPFMDFPMAYQNAYFMDQALTSGNVSLEFHNQKAVLWDVISQCCARKLLHHKWHPTTAGVVVPN